MGRSAHPICRLVRFIDRTYHALLTVIAAIVTTALAACSDDAPVAPAVSDGNVYLRFVISSGERVFTRDIGVWEEEDADAAERLMSVSDMRIYLFDDVTDKLITTLRPADFPWIGGNDGYYTLTASFPVDKLEEFNDFGSDAIRLKIAIAANIGACGGEYPAIAEGMDYSALEPTFAMLPDYFPSSSNAAGIPMYGVRSYNVSMRSLETSVEATPVDIEPLYMLRSLCKVELSDVMTNKFTADDGTVYPRVESVTMSRWNRSGNLRFAPERDGDYFQNNTITRARILTDVITGSKRFVAVSDNTWRIYLPESNLSDAVMTISVTRAPGLAPENYVYNFASADQFGTTELIRNHIYRFDLTAVGATASLIAKVKPWVSVDTDLDYSETITLNKYPTWLVPQGSSHFEVEAGSASSKPLLHIYNGTSDYIACEFEIASPKGATWSAQLIPGQNGVNAFEFVTLDAYGNISGGSQVISGTVGTATTIYLRGKGDAPLIDCYADMVILVRNADGTALYSPVDYNQNTRYGIIRHRPMF